MKTNPKRDAVKEAHHVGIIDLATDPTPLVASAVGVSEYTVKAARNQLGIPAPKPRSGRPGRKKDVNINKRLLEAWGR